MKYIKKIIICIIILIFSSGCTVNYNLDINEDKSVNESVEAIESSNIVKSKTGLKGEKAVDYLFDMFKRGDDKIKVSSKEENNQLIANAYASYSTLEDYKEIFSSDVFDEVDIVKNDNEITITANQTNKLGGVGKTLIYDELSIRIKSPFIVTDNNADKVEGNTYIWNIKKGEDLKTIKYTINIKDKKNAANIDIGNNVINIKYEYIIVGIFLVLILSVFIVISVKNKKNNML